MLISFHLLSVCYLLALYEYLSLFCYEVPSVKYLENKFLLDLAVYSFSFALSQGNCHCQSCAIKSFVCVCVTEILCIQNFPLKTKS